jgi:hypothetical protein
LVIFWCIPLFSISHTNELRSEVIIQNKALPQVWIQEPEEYYLLYIFGNLWFWIEWGSGYRNVQNVTFYINDEVFTIHYLNEVPNREPVYVGSVFVGRIFFPIAKFQLKVEQVGYFQGLITSWSPPIYGFGELFILLIVLMIVGIIIGSWYGIRYLLRFLQKHDMKIKIPLKTW